MSCLEVDRYPVGVDGVFFKRYVGVGTNVKASKMNENKEETSMLMFDLNRCVLWCEFHSTLQSTDVSKLLCKSVLNNTLISASHFTNNLCIQTVTTINVSILRSIQ